LPVHAAVLRTAGCICCRQNFREQKGRERVRHAQGGICSTVVTYTNLSGKLESTPEQPTMTGYSFDGWYTEPVGGSKVTTSTVFTSDATIYAHWTAKAGTSTVPQPTTQPAAQWQKYVGPALVAGALLTTLLVATMF
jgi:uncharacterized repeat protein (TIGR02543 family)